MIVVIKRDEDEQLKVFEISESQFQKLRTEPIQYQTSSYQDKAIDLYKMEYERCAQRYDDLYKAAWTNFSYIALIAGAILTFGRESFMTELSIFLATLPLLFWWIATFEPLNRYGDHVHSRAVNIEKLLNEVVKFGSTERLSADDKEELERAKGLRHFQEFEQRRFKIRWKKLLIVVLFWIVLNVLVLQRLFDLSNYIDWICVSLGAILLILWLIIQCRYSPRGLGHVLRVRFIVRAFAGAVMIIAVSSAVGAYRRHQPPHSEPYLKSSSSKLPERLNIKIEQ